MGTTHSGYDRSLRCDTPTNFAVIQSCSRAVEGVAYRDCNGRSPVYRVCGRIGVTDGEASMPRLSAVMRRVDTRNDIRIDIV